MCIIGLNKCLWSLGLVKGRQELVTMNEAEEDECEEEADESHCTRRGRSGMGATSARRRRGKNYANFRDMQPKCDSGPVLHHHVSQLSQPRTVYGFWVSLPGRGYDMRHGRGTHSRQEVTGQKPGDVLHVHVDAPPVLHRPAWLAAAAVLPSSCVTPN